MSFNFSVGDTFIKNGEEFTVKNIVSKNKTHPYQCCSKEVFRKILFEAIERFPDKDVLELKNEVVNDLLLKEFASETIQLSDFDIMQCKYVEAQKTIEQLKTTPESYARSAKAVEHFPYKSKLLCYIEVMSNGTVKDVSYSQHKREALENVKSGESRLFAVWPGQWRSDLFKIDDIEAFAASL